MITASVDTKSLEHKLADFYADTKKPMPDILRQIGRAEAVSFARSTQPYTGSAGWDASQKTGQAKVARDIRKIYATGGDVFEQIKRSGGNGLEDAFYYFYQSGQIKGKKGAEALMQASKASAVTHLQISKLNPSYHRASRDQRGRVAGKGKRWKQVVTKDGQLKSYIAKKQKLVGFAKGGWAAAAKQLGGARGIPGWVTRQKTPGSAADNSRRETAAHVIIHNHLPYASEVLPAGAEDEALRGAKDRLLKMIEVATAKAAAKANRR